MRLLFLVFLISLPAFAQISPFGFEANDGSLPSDIRFIRRSRETPIYITGDSVVLPSRVRLQIANVPPSISPVGAALTPTFYNYYLGNDPSRWRTGLRLFSEVLLHDIAPGLNASFASSIQLVGGSTSAVRGILCLNAAPGSNLSAFRLNVLNTGTSAVAQPGSIWFVGGGNSVLLILSAKITQRDGTAILPIAGGLKIESSETLSIDTVNLNSNLPTEVEISYPFFETSLPLPALESSSDGIRYLQGTISTLQYVGSDATLARLDSQGRPIWVSLYGGDGREASGLPAIGLPAIGLPVSLSAGVAVAGSTDSTNFPVTANAPFQQLRGPGDAFLAFFDRDTGRLKSASYAGLGSSASVGATLPAAANDLLLSGSISGDPQTGFILRWQMQDNRMLFTRRLSAPVQALDIDSRSRILYATLSSAPRPVQIFSGVLDATGKEEGVAAITAPLVDWVLVPAKLTSLPGDDYLLTYTTYQQYYQGSIGARPRLIASKYSTKSSAPLWNRQLGIFASQAQVGLTPRGNLKFQASTAQPDAATTANAELVAQCPGTEYFQILSPNGELLYASYVQLGAEDFAERNEPPMAPPPRLSCIAATAGRGQLRVVAPGQMITLTGAGFGPATALYASPGADGKYPLEFAGFRARVAGLDAPLIAVARGLIAIQVPLEIPTGFSPIQVELSEQNRSLNSLTVAATPHQFSLFDSGGLYNTLGYPQLAALNQDGTVNGPNNPAAPGSVISLFGSGLGLLSPPLTTGGLNPLPPTAPLSTTPLFRAARGGNIEYLGSAPGLSTSVVQLNVRLPDYIPGSGLRFHDITPVVANSVVALAINGPSRVIYVR